MGKYYLEEVFVRAKMVLSKKRIILIAVLGCLVLIGLLSMIGVIPNKYARVDKTGSKVPYKGKSYTELKEIAGEGAQVRQYISNFVLPRYDETGKEVFSITGKEAFLINEQQYTINRPEIHIRGAAASMLGSDDEEDDSELSEEEESEDKESGPQDIVITSKKGEMNRKSNVAVLTGNVVVKLSDNTTLTTERMLYYPEEKKARTDEPVFIRGERMNITGLGMEAEMTSGKMSIEKNVVAEIMDTDSSLFVVSLGDEEEKEDNGEKKERPKRIYIRSSGRMVFEKDPNMVTFHDDVKVRKGNSTMTTDKMTIVFGKDGKKAKMIIAEGNVTASDGEKVAKSDTLYWDAVTGTTTLEGVPNASFFEEKMSMIAPKLLFNQTENKVSATNGGQLTTKGFEEGSSEDGMLGSGNVTITWQGRMRFDKSEGEAVFEENVHTSRKNFKMNSDKLIIEFDKEGGMKAKGLRATGGAYMVENEGGNLREVYGDEVHWSKDTGVIEVLGEGTLYIQGKGSVKDGASKGMTNISWAKKMVRDEKNMKISFFGNVIALKGEEQVECNKLNAFLTEGNKVRRVVALGDVVYNDTKEGGLVAIGDVLEWDWKINKMVLSGTPTVEVRKQGARTFAKRVYYDPETQRLSWREKPKWQIPLEGKDADMSIPLELY
ncbi:MAG: LPS export ABC transporter periplasmic protein LptC [Candidatus Brocadiales bacterium]